MKLKNKVPLPESGIIIRRSGQYQYVYKVLKTFRTDKGNPTNTRKIIGKLDSTGGMLIPNAAYWELYENHESVDVVLTYKSVRSIGATFLIRRILENLGVTQMLCDIFGVSRSAIILSTAIYMVCRGNVFELATYWCEEFTFDESPLTSQGTSKLFASITFDEKMAFFKSWVSGQKHHEYLYHS